MLPDGRPAVRVGVAQRVADLLMGTRLGAAGNVLKLLDLVVDEADLMSTAIAFAQSTSNLNAAAHSLSKKRMRAPIIAAIREGLVKDDEGWKKQFLA